MDGGMVGGLIAEVCGSGGTSGCGMVGGIFYVSGVV
jgi:hypothetical protein